MSATIQQPLIPFIPLLYVAWADGILEPGEIEYIENQIKTNSSLKPETKNLVCKWLNPANPPSARELAFWKSYIKKNAALLSATEKQNLFSIGQHLVNDKNGSTIINDETQQSLNRIEDYLGIISNEAIRSVLDDGINDFAQREVIYTLKHLLKNNNSELRAKVQSILNALKDEIDNPSYDLKKQREKTLEWCKALSNEGLGALAYPKEYGGQNSLDKYCTVFEEISKYDLSLAIKLGVHFGLFGGSVASLGTEKHHNKYLKDIATMKLPGCFAMTEMHHGSNVKE